MLTTPVATPPWFVAISWKQYVHLTVALELSELTWVQRTAEYATVKDFLGDMDVMSLLTRKAFSMAEAQVTRE